MARKVGLWVLAAIGALLAIIAFNLFQPAASPHVGVPLSYSDMLAEAASGDVASVVLRGHTLTGREKSGRAFETYLPDDPTLASRLAGQGVHVLVGASDDDPSLLRSVVGWLPSLLFLLIWGLSLRRITGEVRALRRAVEAAAGRGPGSSDVR